MAYTVPLTEPTELRLGDTLIWDRDLPDYPPATWTATAYIRGLTVASIVGVANGALHRFTAAAATTATWTLGYHGIMIRVASGSEVHSLDEWKVDFLPNYSTLTATYDGRSFYRRLLDDIEDVLEARAPATQLSYAMGSRSGQFIDHKALRDMHAWALQKLSNEDALLATRRGAANPNQFYATFV